MTTALHVATRLSRGRPSFCSAILFASTFLSFLILVEWREMTEQISGSESRREIIGWGSAIAALMASSARALLVCGAVWLVRRTKVLTLTLAFLSLPYFLFFVGWLRAAYAVPFCLLLLLGVARAWRREAREGDYWTDTTGGLTRSLLIASLIVFAWVLLSGAGGFGHQSTDYLMHNGRLTDLISYKWPVHYSTDKNLVFYVAYYLPSALLGKLFGQAVGLESLFFWTLLGMLIVVAWVFEILRNRSVLVILPFVVFGGLDWVGVQLLDVSDRWFVMESEWPEWWWHDYVASRQFIGGILSNTFSLFWAPHQVIGGWIIIATMTKLYLAGRKASLVFVFALCSAWSALIMLALVPFVVVAVLDTRIRDWREVLSFENAVAGPLIALLFGVYYLGGSALVNPAGWLWEAADLTSKWPSLFLFYALEFGVYAACAWPFVRRRSRRERLWFLTALAILIALPLYRYGSFSDLACRGTTPALFVLILAITASLGQALKQGRRFAALALLLPLSIGATAAIPELWAAVYHFGRVQPSLSVTSYAWGWEQLGDDSSIFKKFIARR